MLRHCLSAGEPLNPEVTDEWMKGTGLEIREGYGQTETVSEKAWHNELKQWVNDCVSQPNPN